MYANKKKIPYSVYMHVGTMETPDEVNYPIQVELAFSINEATLNGLSDVIEVMFSDNI